MRSRGSSTAAGGGETTSTSSGGRDTDAPIRIAYVIPNLEAGGTEGHLLSLVGSIDRSRFSPSVVTTAGGGALYAAFRAAAPVTVLGGSPDASRRFRPGPATHLRALRALAAILREARPDVVHAYLPAANVIAPVAARLAGAGKVVVSKRGLANYKAAYPLVRRVEWLGNRLADVVLVNSDAVRRDVERTERSWEGKFRKIHNGVAPIPPWSAEQVAAFRAREGIPPGAKVALAVSNFYPYKGHADLVQAAARVAAAEPEALFLLAGRDSGSLGSVRALVERLGIGSRVRFAGPRDDVPDLLRASDLFVHPSHEEGFSNAILEAMAAGLPVVACDVGGNPEAVADGETGRLVPPRDPGALAAALGALLADAPLRERMGEAGRRRAAQSFSLERMVRDFERLYAGLAGRGE